MKKIDEYIKMYFAPSVETDKEALERVLRQLAEDVREECAKECEKNDIQKEWRVDEDNFHDRFDELSCNSACHNTDATAIRNLKLFEEL